VVASVAGAGAVAGVAAASFATGAFAGTVLAFVAGTGVGVDRFCCCGTRAWAAGLVSANAAEEANVSARKSETVRMVLPFTTPYASAHLS
jgi:hypothetical protein